jgi:dihydroneopterin aldolase
MTDRILLANMEFYGHHGVSDEERADAQQIDVDVEMEVDLAPAGLSDDLEQTVNYAKVFKACRAIVEEQSFHLLEAIAEAIATGLLTDFQSIAAVTVRVRKSGVPIDGRLEYAGVEIRRRRANTPAPRAENQPRPPLSSKPERSKPPRRRQASAVLRSARHSSGTPNVGDTSDTF